MRSPRSRAGSREQAAVQLFWAARAGALSCAKCECAPLPTSWEVLEEAPLVLSCISEGFDIYCLYSLEAADGLTLLRGVRAR